MSQHAIRTRLPCHTCLNAKLHAQYEKDVAELKATKGLTQLPQAGLQLDQPVALFSEWTGPEQELRALQEESAYKALKEKMVSVTCRVA